MVNSCVTHEYKGRYHVFNQNLSQTVDADEFNEMTNQVQ